MYAGVQPARQNREYTLSEVRDVFDCGEFRVTTVTPVTFTPERDPCARLASMSLAVPAALTGKVDLEERDFSSVALACG